VIVVGGFNTSVDKRMELDELVVGRALRARRVTALPGGKGLHVALTVAALGEPVRLVGIIDEAQHARFASFLETRGVIFDAVRVRGEVRTCLAVHDDAGRVTEILEPGPVLDPAERDALLARFQVCAAQADLAVLSGSVPRGVEPASYADLVDALRARGVPCLVDASGEALRRALEARPRLVKPNRDEAREVTGLPLDSVESAARAAAQLVAGGVGLSVVSLGADGAVGCGEGTVLHALAPLCEAQNPVGSGDCLLGGMAVGLRRGLALRDVLRLGVACGTANAVTAETGILRREDVEVLLPGVSVRNLG
jgi:1-phosphofructokinase family hexose kinase